MGTFGFSGFIPDLLLAIAPFAILSLLILNWRKNYTQTIFYFRLFATIVVCIAWIIVFWGRLASKTQNYIFIKTLKAENIEKITIGETTWMRQMDTQEIVVSLNKAVWFSSYRDGLSRDNAENMRISLKDGSIKNFRVARYKYGNGALIQFFRPMNNGGEWIDDETFIPDFPELLEKLKHSLP